MPSSDDQLIREARSGSREAVERLLALCSPVVDAYLRKQVGSALQRHTSLSDLRQETLIRGADALRVLPDDASLDDVRALLVRHAQWAIGRAARKGREFAGESAIAAGPLPESTPTPEASEGAVTRSDELAKLGADIERLEQPLADVVRLRLRGRSFGEIARELGLTEDTARKRLLRAALLLRERHAGREGT